MPPVVTGVGVVAVADLSQGLGIDTESAGALPLFVPLVEGDLVGHPGGVLALLVVADLKADALEGGDLIGVGGADGGSGVVDGAGGE